MRFLDKLFGPRENPSTRTGEANAVRLGLSLAKLVFDESWYRAQLSGPIASDEAFDHYCSVGARTDLSPNPFFDPRFYRGQRHDLQNPDVNPLIHYLTYGHNEGLLPTLLFDGQFYQRSQKTDFGGLNHAYVHYCEHGARASARPHLLYSPTWYARLHGVHPSKAMAHCIDRRYHNPHPLFDENYYCSANSIDSSIEGSPFNHFLSVGYKKGFSPHPLFDIIRYCALYSDVAESGLNPLMHYLESGENEGRSPHALIDVQWLSKQPLNPDNGTLLEAYVAKGADESVSPHPEFDQRRYIALHEDRLASNSCPLVHYLTSGWREGRDPSALFSVQYYLTNNDDVRAANVEPFTHFISSGKSEGRFPRPPDRDFDSVSPLDISFEVWRVPSITPKSNACVFNTYSPDGKILPHVVHLISSLKNSGVVVIVVIATDGLTHNPLDDIPEVDGLIIRDNHGWDFGAWASTLTIVPALWSANSVILCNDSIYGPVSNIKLRQALSRVWQSASDIVAMTDSYEVRHHFQSYFWALTRKGLDNPAIKNWWMWVASVKSKDVAIATYELYGIDRWRNDGASIDVLFPAKATPRPVNPTLQGWRDLTRRGFPFLKVQMLRDEVPGVRRDGWRASIETGSPLIRLIEHHLQVTGAEHRPQPIRQRGGTNEKRSAIPSVPRDYKRFVNSKTYYGATSAVVISPETDRVLQVPFRVSSDDMGAPVAAIVHVYYVEMLAELISYIRHIRNVELFISTDSNEKVVEIQRICRDYGFEPDVRCFKNRGRDIAPFLIGFRDVFERFAYVLHLHSKKSPHEPRMAGWKKYLLDTLVGSPAVVASVMELLKSDRVGLVFAQHYPEVRRVLNWGFNFQHASTLMARLGITIYQDQLLDFPSSSFFWVKSAAIAPLLNERLEWAEFAEESGQVDGTLAHAIERVIPLVVEAAGFSYVKVGLGTELHESTLIPRLANEDIRVTVDRVCSHISENRSPSDGELRAFPEVPVVKFRASSFDKPRLNLCVPTVEPRHIFGGLSTAFKVFNEIASSSDTVDLRIISVTTPLSLQGGVTFPEFPIQQLDDPMRLERAIVSVAPGSRGALSVRRNDVFFATAWWTAVFARSAQRFQHNSFGSKQKLLYLIQDDERGFYPWSSSSGLVSSTYCSEEDLVAIINSEELANHFGAEGLLSRAYALPYTANSRIVRHLVPVQKERLILVYGRPSVSRNAFETIIAGLLQWQLSEPTLAAQWHLVFAGESFGSERLAGLINAQCVGKLTEVEYASYLSRCAAGVSLMLSPHPSYPPLEMASAGLITLTNIFGVKDLTARSPNVVSIASVDPRSLALALSKVVARAERRVGTIVPYAPVSAPKCTQPRYSPTEVVQAVGLRHLG